MWHNYHLWHGCIIGYVPTHVVHRNICFCWIWPNERRRRRSSLPFPPKTEPVVFIRCVCARQYSCAISYMPITNTKHTKMTSTLEFGTSRVDFSGQVLVMAFKAIETSIFHQVAHFHSFFKNRITENSRKEI